MCCKKRKKKLQSVTSGLTGKERYIMICREGGIQNVMKGKSDTDLHAGKERYIVTCREREIQSYMEGKTDTYIEI